MGDSSTSGLTNAGDAVHRSVAVRCAKTAAARWAIVVAAAVSTLIAGCPQDRIVRHAGCLYDDDCLSDERCYGARCILRAQPDSDAGQHNDAGNQDVDDAGDTAEDDGGEVSGHDAGMADDGGVPMTDGGEADGGTPACVPDGFNNDSLEGALELSAGGSAGVEGVLCPGVSEWFRFAAWGGDPIHLIATWPHGADLDLYYSAPEQETGTLIGASTMKSMEVTTTTLGGGAGYDYHVIEIRQWQDVPTEGVPYRLELRTGIACHTDDNCLTPDVCLMPIWSPAQGQAPASAIFGDGVCGLPYTPCDPAVADNPVHEGDNSSRSGAVAGLPEPAWSCQYDEDWWVVTQPQTGDTALRFFNRATEPGIYLVSAYDEHGNMLAGSGFVDAPSDEEMTLTIPKYGDGETLFIRTLQLHDDNVALYDIDGDTLAAQCLSGEDCADDPAASSFGRVDCSMQSSACTCPVNGCEAP